MTTTALILALLGVMAGFALGLYVARRWLWPAAGSGDLAAEQAVVREGLARLQDQLHDLEHQRASWQGQLAAQVSDMRTSTESLRQETTALSSALRRPQVRGRWGELHLRRCVELAGMVAHCDFAEQVSVAGDDGRGRRPDVVVNLAGGRQLAVDAKVPLDAFLDATGASTDEERDRHLHRHVAQVRRHIDQLGDRRYWSALPDTPELTVLFLPAESFLVAALESATDLIAHAAKRGVVLATPMTLIALLRTVAHDWRQEAVTARAREIHQLGVHLHRRINTMSGHLDQLGRSLNAAVGHFNGAVGSWEQRVLVAARRFDDLAADADALDAPRPVDSLARRAAHSPGDDGPTVAV